MYHRLLVKGQILVPANKKQVEDNRKEVQGPGSFNAFGGKMCKEHGALL